MKQAFPNRRCTIWIEVASMRVLYTILSSLCKFIWWFVQYMLRLTRRRHFGHTFELFKNFLSFPNSNTFALEIRIHLKNWWILIKQINLMEFYRVTFIISLCHQIERKTKTQQSQKIRVLCLEINPNPMPVTLNAHSMQSKD